MRAAMNFHPQMTGIRATLRRSDHQQPAGLANFEQREEEQIDKTSGWQICARSWMAEV
jgi:hypothetical protein